ncbi:hypothetical protein B5G43_12480 [Flavonifractor sp. An92]|uniref:phage distal tail protein n=1 Tax=Flavonifractor sp. An92 TaxID=1965666 RepID=UPI000B39432F|nr:phage tail domain-containing protein [Flavonifractor sp. An92]OUN05497.1 hypothetical protein B5G43_12480 [Flavonifractor sp. An92]
MRSVSWRSDSGRICTFEGGGPFERPGPWYFRSLTSDLSATAETAKAPRQDGVTTFHTALDAPTLNLTGSMLVYGSRRESARAAYDRQRTWLAQTFAPNRWGTLTYYREDGAVQIRCRPLATPTISAPVGTFSTIDLSFTADSPYWESAEESVAAVGVIGKVWRFPWAPVSAPMGTFSPYAAIENPTDVDIYPTVEVFTTGQYVTVSKLDTGEQVTIQHPIAPGQKLTIDMADVTAWLWEQDEAGDYQRGEDVSHWMSLDSTPWALTPGENRLAVKNEVPEDTPVAYIRWRVPSLGI